jgi:hypothetical protein
MRTLIFAGIILASSAALTQSPAQKAKGMSCYEFYLDLGAFAIGPQFSSQNYVHSRMLSIRVGSSFRRCIHRKAYRNDREGTSIVRLADAAGLLRYL